MSKRMVGVNERGLRVGQDHQRAKLPDHYVEMIRQLRDGGMSYRKLAEKFGIGVRTVRDICAYTRRAQSPVRWKEAR